MHPLILNLGSSWRRVFSFTPGLFHSFPLSHLIAMQYAPGCPKVSPVIRKTEHCLGFAGDLVTLPWSSTSQPSHIMHISVASVWSTREETNITDHRSIEGQCAAGQGYESNVDAFLIRWWTAYIHKMWGFCVLLEDLLADNGFCFMELVAVKFYRTVWIAVKVLPIALQMLGQKR